MNIEQIYFGLSVLFLGASIGSWFTNRVSQQTNPAKPYENTFLFAFIGGFINIILINFIKKDIDSGFFFYLMHAILLLFIIGLLHKNKQIFKRR